MLRMGLAMAVCYHAWSQVIELNGVRCVRGVQRNRDSNLKFEFEIKDCIGFCHFGLLNLPKTAFRFRAAS